MPLDDVPSTRLPPVGYPSPFREALIINKTITLPTIDRETADLLCNLSLVLIGGRQHLMSTPARDLRGCPLNSKDRLEHPGASYLAIAVSECCVLLFVIDMEC